MKLHRLTVDRLISKRRKLQFQLYHDSATAFDWKASPMRFHTRVELNYSWLLDGWRSRFPALSKARMQAVLRVFRHVWEVL